MMPVISALLDGVLMLIVENGNLHETRNPVTICQVTKLHTTRRHRTETQSAATFGEATSYKESCLLCCELCLVTDQVKLFICSPCLFREITRCLSASLFRAGHSGQVSTVQHSGCFGRSASVTSLIFRDVNISKQHPQLSTQLLVGLKRWL